MYSQKRVWNDHEYVNSMSWSLMVFSNFSSIRCPLCEECGQETYISLFFLNMSPYFRWTVVLFGGMAGWSSTLLRHVEMKLFPSPSISNSLFKTFWKKASDYSPGQFAKKIDHDTQKTLSKYVILVFEVKRCELCNFKIYVSENYFFCRLGEWTIASRCMWSFSIVY